MAKELVSDELWEIVEPLLPAEPPKPRGARPRVPNRAALTGIVFVLKMGIPWEMLSKEMGRGSGSTCWRRLRDWQEAGVWRELHHRALLDRLGEAGGIDWSRACLDSASVPAKKGARRSARTRRIAANWASGASATLFRTEGRPARRSAYGRQRPRLEVFEELVDEIAPIRRLAGKPGRPRKRPAKLHADKGYDFPRCRKALRERSIKARIARRGKDTSERLGRHRWVVERTLAWLARYRRLSVRYERRSSILVARSSASPTCREVLQCTLGRNPAGVHSVPLGSPKAWLWDSIFAR